MKAEYFNIIDLEENRLMTDKRDLDIIKNKWFKTSSTNKFIAYMEFYIAEKEKLIKKLRENAI